jgi:hypothetical protein
LVVAAAAVLGAAGCYKPTIKGAFKCNTEYNPPDDCPEGYHCGAGLCVKGSMPTIDSGIDKPVDVKPPMDVPTTADVPPPPVDTGPEVCISNPVMGCSVDTTKRCDPYCQTGCGCQEKCSINTMGEPTCNVPYKGRVRDTLEGCNKASEGTSAQTDDCAPGSFCMLDGCGPRCYKVCRKDDDCPTSACTVNAGGGLKACDVPYVACNPVKNNGMSDQCGTDIDTLGCFLSPTVINRTYCDCSVSMGRVNTICTVSRDCFVGLVCAGPAPTTCRQACDYDPLNPVKGAMECVGGTCMSLNGSKKFGYCN